MKASFNTLEETAKYIVDSLDFTPKSLDDAFSIVFYKTNKIVFDTYSLTIHECQLEMVDRKKLFLEIRNCYVAQKEREKERMERSFLIPFLMNKGLINAIVEKQERPDFILNWDDKKIGVEITEFKARDIAIQDKIIKNVNGKLLSKEEIINVAKKTSSRRYDIFDYESIEGHAAISSMFDVMEHKEEFVITLESKISKYDSMVENFDEFYIIAKASGIEITSSSDIYDVLLELKIKPKNHMILYVEYEDNSGPKVYECDLKDFV